METQNVIKIFLVDDDPCFLELLKDNLSKNYAYQVFSFNTGEECLENLNYNRPDLVLLDFHLNSINRSAKNGVEILKRIKVMDQDIPVVIISGSLQLEVPFESYGHGAYCFIEKNEAAFSNINEVILDVVH